MMSRQIKEVILSIFFILALTGLCVAQNKTYPEDISSAQALFEGFVFFTDIQRISLKSEKIWFPSKMDEHKLGSKIINKLFEGPSQTNLEQVWPKGVKLNALFISDGKAWVDLDIGPKMTNDMDMRSELLAVYSLVNSLTLNISGIKMVKILVQGQEAATLAGHLDMGYFYKTNMLIVK
ncbi:MAG: GerMN domain-containing protein [Pseudomonadota bacterium]